MKFPKKKNKVWVSKKKESIENPTRRDELVGIGNRRRGDGHVDEKRIVKTSSSSTTTTTTTATTAAAAAATTSE